MDATPLRLVEAILAGHAGTGRTLLLDALNIWVTNVIIFALWYWALDRGGPASKGSRPDVRNDFLFTQQQPASHAFTPAGRLALSTICFWFRRLTRSRSPSGLSF